MQMQQVSLHGPEPPASLQFHFHAQGDRDKECRVNLPPITILEKRSFFTSELCSDSTEFSSSTFCVDVLPRSNSHRHFHSTITVFLKHTARSLPTWRLRESCIRSSRVNNHIFYVLSSNRSARPLACFHIVCSAI